MHRSKNMLQLIIRIAECKSNTSSRLVILRYLLTDISIDSCHRSIICVSIKSIKCLCCCIEEVVIEPYDVRQASVISIQHRLLISIKLRRNCFIKKFPVRPSPAIDTLLHITNNEILTSLRLTVLQKRAEISPLHFGSVLKLIQKKMFESYSQFLINERSIRTINDVPEKSIRIIDAKHILFLHQFLKSSGQFRSHSKAIKLVIKYLCSVVDCVFTSPEITEIIERSFKIRVNQRKKRLCLSLCEPLLMISRPCKEGILRGLYSFLLIYLYIVI